MSKESVESAIKLAEYVGVLIVLVGLFFFGWAIVTGLESNTVTTTMLVTGIGAGLVGGSEAALVKAMQR